MCDLFLLSLQSGYENLISSHYIELVYRSPIIFYVISWLIITSRGSITGTCRWGEFGEGGLLWGECNGRHFEWFEGNPVSELLSKVNISHYHLTYPTFVSLAYMWDNCVDM